MVFYFEATGGYKIYMGKDKYENELLIKYGWPEDIWYHVDDLSSAHVYLRLPRGPVRKRFRETGNLDHIKDVVEDCCQLVKANSIEGSKKSNVSVVYTEWENLKKSASMVDGQVGFHNQTKVIKLKGIERNREIVNRLNKTKVEAYPDLEKERLERDQKVRAKAKQRAKQTAKKEQEEKDRLRAEKDARDYKHMQVEELMVSNADMKSSEDTSAAVDYEDDFM